MNAPAELTLGQTAASREAGLWLAAAVVILLAHAAFAYALHALSPFEPPAEAEQQALVIDLAPLPISVPETVAAENIPEETPLEQVQPVEEPVETNAEQPDRVVEVEEMEPAERTEPETLVAPEPEQIQPEHEVVQPVIPEPDAPEPVETEIAAIEPETVEAVEPEPEVIEQEITEVVEPEIEAEAPEVVLPKPKPKPVAKKAEPKARKKVEQAKPRPKPRAKAAAAKPAKPASRASQESRVSKAPTINPARWNSAVRAAVARRASSVRGMRGTVRVQFVVSSGGAIVSARVSGSSGNARLDSAALRMVRSARVPRAPAGMSGSHSFAIPLTFR